MTTTTRTRKRRTNNPEVERAKPVGAYVATAGSLILLVSVWTNWVGLGVGDSETANSSSGYEVDSLVPFMGLLGLGFSLALLYATGRADRGQHRGLSLASMAVGLASLLWIVFFLIDPIETVKYAGYDGEADPNVSTEFGVWIGMVGALLWAAGSLILAKEPEGDINHDETHIVKHDAHRTVEGPEHPVQPTRNAEVTETRPANVTDREVRDRRPTNTPTVTGTSHGTSNPTTGANHISRDDVITTRGTRRNRKPGRGS